MLRFGIEIGAASNSCLFFTFFFNLNFKTFHVFLVKVLNIILADRTRSMHLFYTNFFQSLTTS